MVVYQQLVELQSIINNMNTVVIDSDQFVELLGDLITTGVVAHAASKLVLYGFNVAKTNSKKVQDTTYRWYRKAVDGVSKKRLSARTPPAKKVAKDAVKKNATNKAIKKRK